MSQNPYLNGGCGRVILPATRPAHYALIDAAVLDYPLWVNADRNPEPGVDCVTDLFQVPWPWPDNSFDGALFSHFMEHVPHDIRLRDDSPRAHQLARCQDGWYAIWAEVCRVLTPGSIIHVLSPYAWSQGAVTDPSHTRLLTEHVFTHSMQPDVTSPFRYETAGVNLRLVSTAFGLTPLFAHLAPQPDDAPTEAEARNAQLTFALQTRVNVACEIYAKLEVVK